MQLLYIVLSLVLIFATASAQNNDIPVPQFFRDPATSLKLGQCQNVCQRRPVSTWSDGDWRLYAQLYNEANARGYITSFTQEHNSDCSNPARGGVNGGCLYHFSQNTLPWHRLFTLHYEQILQLVDVDINPGRAERDGVFCLGYWNWGFGDAFFSNNPQDYTYLFNQNAVGTLEEGPIPDGYYANLNVGGRQSTRDPSMSSNQWSNVAIASCFQSDDIECNDDANCGFRPCVEYMPHNAIHNSVGGSFASYWAPSDPVFFLHHAMVDYLFAVWERNRGTFTPPGWNRDMPRPYDDMGVDLVSTFGTVRHCYDYTSSSGQVSAPARQDVPQPFAQEDAPLAPDFEPVGTPVPVGTPQPSARTEAIAPGPVTPRSPGEITATRPAPSAVPAPAGDAAAAPRPGTTLPNPTPPGAPSSFFLSRDTPTPAGGDDFVQDTEPFHFSGPGSDQPAPNQAELNERQTAAIVQTIKTSQMPEAIPMEKYRIIQNIKDEIVKMQIYYKYLQAVWNAQIVWLVINQNYNPEPFGLSYDQIPGKGGSNVHEIISIFSYDC